MPDDFFIGWLPVPARSARYLGVVVPLLLLLVAIVAGALPLWQQSPGDGAWESDAVCTVEGIIQAQPYALLRTLAGEDDSVRTLLLVEEGKFGAGERAEPLAGQYVRATGTLLHRDDRWMLELSSRPDALVPVRPGSRPAVARAPASRPQHAGPVALQGEVIDPKCYLGAMRPGGGKTHKACAMLCIAGGIPPMFVTRDQAGRETFYLLASHDGTSAKDVVLDFIGDMVELRGQLVVEDDLRLLRLAPGGVRRL
jgi:hypothetical protein